MPQRRRHGGAPARRAHGASTYSRRPGAGLPSGHSWRPRHPKETDMKYLIAWALGVPGVLVLAWMLFS